MRVEKYFRFPVGDAVDLPVRRRGRVDNALTIDSNGVNFKSGKFGERRPLAVRRYAEEF